MSFKIKEGSGPASFLPRTLFRSGRLQFTNTSCYRHGNEKFVLKEIYPEYWELRLKPYRLLGPCPYVRGIEDTAQDHSIFVFKYFNETLLGLVHKDLPLATTKRILKDRLRGLAAMHDKDLFHTGRKAYHFPTASRSRMHIRYQSKQYHDRYLRRTSGPHD